MNLNFSYRIFTSIFLLAILFTCLFTNKYLWLSLVILTSIISLYEFNNLIVKIFKKNKKKLYLINLVTFFYLIIFIFLSYNFYNNAKFDLIFVFLICIFSDSGGYVIGNLIGGKKLTKISPNKTVSGSVGSFLFSLIPILIFYFLNNQINNLTLYQNNLSILFLTCLFLSLTCQLGDLFISYFKRKAKVKDTGKILPGHGGLLDRIDGLIFVLPMAFLLQKIYF